MAKKQAGSEEPNGQFNSKIPKELIELARRDAKTFKKSFHGITAAIFRAHFAFKTEVRAQLYRSLPPKRMGRKVGQ